MRKYITCTVCPLSCEIVLELNQDGEILSLTGNKCARGKTYATKEHTAPERTLTTIVRAKGGLHPLLPVRTDVPIPKEKLEEAMQATLALQVQAPVKMGDVIVADFLNLGVNLVASRDL